MSISGQTFSGRAGWVRHLPAGVIGLLMSACLCAVLAGGSARAGARAGLGGFRWSSEMPQANALHAVVAAEPGTGGVGFLAVGDASTFLLRRSPLDRTDTGWLCGRGRPVRPDLSFRAVAVLRQAGLVAVAASDGSVLLGDGCRMDSIPVAQAPLNTLAWSTLKGLQRLSVAGDQGAAFYWDAGAGKFVPARLDPALPGVPDVLALDAPPATDTEGVVYAAGRVQTPNGPFGVILRSQDAGASWALLTNTPPAQEYRDVSFLSPLVGYAFGSRDGKGFLAFTSDGGQKWQIAGFMDGSVRSIAAFNAERLVAVGDAGILAGVPGQMTPRPEPVEGLVQPIPLEDVEVAGSEAWAVGRNGVIFTSRDYGETWAPFNATGVLHAESLRPLNAIQYLSEKDVVVAGDGGALLRSADAGETFQPVALPTGNDILALATPGQRNAGTGSGVADSIVAVGAHRTILRYDAASGRWTLRGSVPAVDLHAAAMLDTPYGFRRWAVGESGTIVSNLSPSPLWTVAPTGTAQRLNAIQALPLASGTGFMAVVVGDGGTILHSTDGLRWPAWKLPDPYGAVNLRGVLFLNAGTGFVVGDGGFIARTTDSGASWSVSNTSTKADLFAIDSYPPGTAEAMYAVGAHQTVLFSRDGGSNWVVLPAPAPNDPAPDFIYRAVQIVGPDHVFIAGEQGHLLEKVPGVPGWMERGPGGPETFYALRMVDALTGMSVSDDPRTGPRVGFTTQGWLKETDAALPRGTLPLYGGDTDGKRFLVVGAGGTILGGAGSFGAPSFDDAASAVRAVVSPNPGEYLAAGEGGLLIRSADDGLTWQSVPLDNPFGPDVDFRALAFQAPDANGDAVGYLAGKTPDGKTPVLFVSQDSGRSWKAAPPDVGGAGAGINALAAFSGMVLAGADGGSVFVFDGQAWRVERPISDFTGAWISLSATDARWYVGGEAGRAARWPDADGRPAWMALNTGVIGALRSISGPPVIGLAGGVMGGLSGADGGGESLRDDIRGVCMDPAGVILTETGGLALFGDVNRDTQVNLTDERSVFSTVAGQSSPTEDTVFFGDMDPPSPAADTLPGDGVLDMRDAVRLIRTAMGL